MNSISACRIDVARPWAFHLEARSLHVHAVANNHASDRNSNDFASFANHE